MKKINLKVLIVFNIIFIYHIFMDFLSVKSASINLFYKFVSLIIIAIVSNIIIIFFQRKNFSVEKKFLIIALFIGISYIFISPLFKGIDEGVHFSRIYTFFTDSKTDKEGFFKIPYSFEKIIIASPKNAFFTRNLNTKISSELLEKDIRGGMIYTPISYLPYLLPVWILGILIKTNVVTLVFSTRFCGFLVYLVSSVYAIKTVPKRKDFIALFCLMPIVISSGATITGDLLTNSSIIVFFAIWYRLYLEKKQISKKDIILMVITGIITGCAKMIYVLEFLLLFFLPVECFGGKKSKKALILSVIVGIIGIATLINSFSAISSVNQSYSSFSLQHEFILKNPIRFLIILINSILSNYNFLCEFTTNYTILDIAYFRNSVLPILYLLGLLISIFNDGEVDLKLSTKKKSLIFIIGFIIIAVMYISLYLQWTSDYEIGGNYIDGMQSRYYIPVMLMLLICLKSNKEFLDLDKNIPYYISFWTNIAIIIDIMLEVI